ncbi:RRP45 [Candida pseudojiufengensis]|uniref:RRP45 n=1 Tax=Candida pseudojiufengensis TaxID=497109 RepID=UPI0022249495|nr:RRP45 [Candida pseudojiufengensis]KAI5959164.1 RRP45 [Candida pseudojiufengensis]
MSRSIEITSNEKNFLHTALKNGIRLSSRKFNQLRDIQIQLSTKEYGYVEVSWGKSKVAVRVSAKITKPYEDRPFEGIFQINNEISSISSLKFDNNTTKVQQQDENLISRIIEKSIRKSNSIDLENLCIIAGEKCWEILVDLNFLNFDGNFIDLGCFATMLALNHFKKPDITISQDSVIIHDLNERQPVGLSILHNPICLTYSFFNLNSKEMNIKGEEIGERDDEDEDNEEVDYSEEICILDADGQEELLRDGSLSITLNKNREILQLSKNGGIPINAEKLLNLCYQSMEHIDYLTELLKIKIKENEEIRYKNENFKLLESSADR